MILKDLNWWATLLSWPDGYHNLIWKDVYVVFSFSRPANVTQLNWWCLSGDFMSPGCAQWGQSDWLWCTLRKKNLSSLPLYLVGNTGYWIDDCSLMSDWLWLICSCIPLQSANCSCVGIPSASLVVWQVFLLSMLFPSPTHPPLSWG